jgi:predicted Fe-Mo cluster-binding NifX family protein
MKIAIPAAAPNLDARIEPRLGTASYLIAVDVETGAFESVKGPSTSHGPGSGIQTISLCLGMGVRTILTGYMSPDIARTLRQNGIEVVTSVSGSVRNAVDAYNRGEFRPKGNIGRRTIKDKARSEKPNWQIAFQKTIRQLAGMLPVLLGVILLVGLLHGFLPQGLLLSAFSGDVFQDTLLGVLIGSTLAGNPINSYVMGESLLKMGVSLFGVTALMLSWVSVWVIQLPAEKSALGMRFAIIRATAAFLISIPVSIFIVLISGSSG